MRKEQLRNFFKKWSLLFVFLSLIILAYIFDISRFLTLDSIRSYHVLLQEYVSNRPIIASFAYIFVYIMAVALSLPGAIFLSILGGLLFQQPFCTIYIVLGASIGASCIFFIAGTIFKNIFAKMVGPFLGKMKVGFQKDAASYMLFLRFVPIFPFWLVNIAPAFFEVPFFTFAWTTCIGIIPGAFVFAQAGRALASIIDLPNNQFSIEHFFTSEVKISLIALGLFALLPVVLKKIR